jgi:thiol-disulfide isomerase/thioredoxin
MLPIFLLALLASAHGRVVNLTPELWPTMVPGHVWLVYFAVDGCKHCERVKPMMEQVSREMPELRVGRVDASEHNGIARTFLPVSRFPSIVLFDQDGLTYEFEGHRSAARIAAFARRDLRSYGKSWPGGRRAPAELQPNVSDLWLLAEAMWPAIKPALTWSVGIAVGIKGTANLILRCLRGRASGPASTAAKERKAE